MNKIILLFLASVMISFSYANDGFAVKGLCIAAPGKADVEEFVRLIDTKLAPTGLNTLILRVDFGYEFESHPELRDNNPLSKSDVEKLVEVCKKHNKIGRAHV